MRFRLLAFWLWGFYSLSTLFACEERFVCEIGPRSNELIAAEHTIEGVRDIIVDVTRLTDGSYIFAGYHWFEESAKPWKIQGSGHDP